MKRSVFAFISVCIVLTAMSCRKSPPKPVDPNPVIGKLSKLAYSNGSYDSVYYNNDGTIRKIINHSVVPGPYDEIHEFQYDANKKVTRITDNNGEYYAYTYIGGVLAGVSHYVNGSKEDYRTYVYTNGKLTEMEELYRPASNVPGHQLMSKREFSYYPDGNLKLEMVYTADPQTSVLVRDFSIEYLDYDAKLNPIDILSRFLYLSQISLTTQNARKQITKNEKTGAATEFLFEYTYNAFSNPLTRKMTFTSGGQPSQETVTYHY